MSNIEKTAGAASLDGFRYPIQLTALDTPFQKSS